MIMGKIRHISEKDYLTCKKNWNEFNIKNMGDHQDHYLQKGCIVISLCFWKVIDTCLKFYGLDPCHYFSSPGWSRDAMLKMTGGELEKIFDIGMYLFIEKWLNRGIAFIAKRCSKSNNKYMKNHDPKKPSIWIICKAGKWVIIFFMADSSN